MGGGNMLSCWLPTSLLASLSRRNRRKKEGARLRSHTHNVGWFILPWCAVKALGLDIRLYSCPVPPRVSFATRQLSGGPL